MTLGDRLQRIWYADAPPPLLLRSLSAVYGAIAALRRRRHETANDSRRRPGAPVVVVGNITVGGTGKTPLVIWLVQALQGRGYRPGVVSRGYGGSAGDACLDVTVRCDPAETGDEPLLIARRTGVPVAVCRDRLKAARRLVDQGVDVVVSDDGLQHYRLGRDFEIVVLDGERRLGNGRLLPAGPLREPATRLATVDAVVVNGAGRARPGELEMRLVGHEIVRLHDGETRPLASLAGERWHAVAGIGNPGRFFATLRGAGLEVIPHPLPDHADIRREQLVFGDGLPVLMTEKDAVKCRGFGSGERWMLPVRAELSAPGALLNRLWPALRRSAGAARSRKDDGQETA